MSTPIQRVAIVTGAAQGIGRSVAIRLAEDGLNVAVSDLPSKMGSLEEVAAEIRAKGAKAIVVTTDVSIEEQVESLVSRTVKELGGLDVMVANAGIVYMTPLIEMTVQEFQKVYEVNALGVMLCYRIAAKVMVDQGRGGRLIAASSLVGKHGYPGVASYAATKFAVRGLTQAAASELGKYNITANAYAPGAIKTPMLQGMEEKIEGVGMRFMGLTSLKKFGEPEDIANLVSFLASKESGYITGQTISIDGGVHFD